MKRKSPHQGVVHRAVRRRLSELEKNDGFHASADGESYVCCFCVQPVKPCESDPSYACKDKILGETELHGLVTRVHEVTQGYPVLCSMCGKRLTVREVKKNALRELCPACQAGLTRSERRGLNEKGRRQ